MTSKYGYYNIQLRAQSHRGFTLRACVVCLGLLLAQTVLCFHPVLYFLGILASQEHQNINQASIT